MSSNVRSYVANNVLSFLESRQISGKNEGTLSFLKDRLGNARSLYRKDLKGHFGCVNAIEFSHGGEWIASGGDDRRVLLWNTQEALSDRGHRRSMKGEHNSNIFCLAFDCYNKKLYSGGNDEQVVLHDVERGSTLDVFNHDEAVYGLSTDPFCDNIFASACDDGRVCIYDIRVPAGEEPFVLSHQNPPTTPMHAVMFNPVSPQFIATANAKEGVALWDVRNPKRPMFKYGGATHQQSCMSVRINQRGDQLIALRRRLPPILYNLNCTKPYSVFDHQGYYNSCTMKSCCFGGDSDQYVVSGSDDFNLYMWKIPEDQPEGINLKCANCKIQQFVFGDTQSKCFCITDGYSCIS